jgi:mannosyltransferase OCH1-like enzyme
MTLIAPKSIPRQFKRVVALYIIILLVFLFGLNPKLQLPSQSSMKYASFQQPHLVTKPLFPTKLWQIWKVAPLYFEEKEFLRARNWTYLNPTYRYEVLTDDNALMWVEQNYGLTRPDVVHFYRTLGVKIVKADLLRYLIMYIEGGTYADIDVQALKPINAFIPDEFKELERDIDMVVGIEVDQPQYKDHPILGSKSMSFVQWTFMCKPRLAVMLRLVDDIISWVNSLAHEQHTTISNVSLNFDQVLSGSGPAKFTLAVLSEMGNNCGEVVGWSNFHNMTKPKLVGGVLVLPIKAFAASRRNCGPLYCEDANIKHHYHASKWPLTHRRYRHPVYGQLEDCSWDPECIIEWDTNVAAFEKLGLETQARMIEESKGKKLTKKEREWID